MGDNNWHWMSDVQLSNRGPAGNIYYGPQLNAFIEVSRSISPRNVLFINGYGGLGSLEERVTYLESRTISYSGGLSTGLRMALGNRGRAYAQFKINLPGQTKYLNDEFPFVSEVSPSGDILLLYNQPMPWAEFNPDLLGSLSVSWLYQKNTAVQDNILSDHLSVIHISSSIHTWYPIFIAPFVQLESEQLLAPPSIWTGTREKRILASSSAGIDLAISKPFWESIKIRLGLPFIAWSSSNGFPDGTQPAPYLMIAVNTAGVFDRADH
jgi:hypothetical protein